MGRVGRDVLVPGCGCVAAGRLRGCELCAGGRGEPRAADAAHSRAAPPHLCCAKPPSTAAPHPKVYLSDKRVAAGAVNIRTNQELQKVRGRPWLCCLPAVFVCVLLCWPLLMGAAPAPPRLCRRCRRPRRKPRPPCPGRLVWREQDVKAFWLPGKSEAREKLEKPDMNTLCPASGAKLRLKVRRGGWGCRAADLWPGRWRARRILRARGGVLTLPP